MRPIWRQIWHCNFGIYWLVFVDDSPLVDSDSENLSAHSRRGETQRERKDSRRREKGGEKEINGENNAGGVEKNVKEKVQNEGKKEREEMYYYYNHVDMAKKIHKPPPPQLFSDENPNACCIS